MRRFQTPDRNQLMLLPPNLNDWLSPNHPARFVVDVVERMDLTDWYAEYESEAGGRPPYDPKMMLAIWLLAAMMGIQSSRKIERLLMEDIGFRFVAGNLIPDHDTIAEFRKRHAQRINRVFVDVVQMAVKGGFVRLGVVAIDGTKIRASAASSNRKSREQIQHEKNKIEAQIKSYLKSCDRVDDEEDTEFGKGNNGYLLPDFLSDERARQEWIDESLKELAASRESAKDENDDDDLPPKNNPRNKKLKRRLAKLQAAEAALDRMEEERAKNDPTGRLQRERERKRGGEKEVLKVNLTDPDCRRMRSKNDGIREAYNCQAAVDDETGIIVAADVTTDGNDQKQLLPMTIQIKENTDWFPDNVVADTGYFTAKHMEDSRVKSVQFFIPPRKRTSKEGSQTRSEQMRDRLDTELGKHMSCMRKGIVEPVFGAIKHARNFRQMLTKGKPMVTAEWLLHCTGLNLSKLFRAGLAFSL